MAGGKGKALKINPTIYRVYMLLNRAVLRHFVAAQEFRKCSISINLVSKIKYAIFARLAEENRRCHIYSAFTHTLLAVCMPRFVSFRVGCIFDSHFNTQFCWHTYFSLRAFHRRPRSQSQSQSRPLTRNPNSRWRTESKTFSTHCTCTLLN